MLKFDAETTRNLETAYQGAELTRRRQASFDALSPRPQEIILDIGCGNGLLTAELARAVGPQGAVIGIDPSDDMRAAAQSRCSEYKCVELVDGTANKLPIEDGFADKAVSVQVFEYIEDLAGATSEALRVLKPGGKLVISDLHFDSFIWFSDDPDRMNRMISAWDHHFIHRDVPSTVLGILKSAGHVIEDVKPVTLTDHVLKPDGLATMMLLLMKQFAVDNGHVENEEAQSWFDEQHDLARQGRFFFSITQYVVIAIKSG